jgi:chemotaxis protein CheC
MSESIHVLVVRAAGLSWALPMGSVEQTFAFHERQVHNVAGAEVVVFRGDVLEVVRIASQLGFAGDGPLVAGVVVWAGARRRVFAVDELVGQMVLDRQDVPSAAHGVHTSGVVVLGSGEIVPVLEPGVIAGAWSPAGAGAFGFSELQRSALLEIANIGSGNAATALSQLLGKPVEITYAEALLATLAEAADKIGAAAATSAVVDTPVADDGGGKVLLLFPDGAGEQLCELFGTRLDDEMGRSALREVGNILASSYLNAVVEMTGMALAPQPPTIEVDLLGPLVSRSLAGIRADDPTVLMRSVMTVEASDSSFAFLFVPQFGAVSSLLDHLGVGSPKAA